MIRRAINITTFSMLAFAMLVFPQNAQAQRSASFSDLNVDYQFGESFTFSATLSTSTPVDIINLTFRQPGNGGSIVIEVQADDEGRIRETYQLEAKDHFAPFTMIEYWFTATTESGMQIQSETAAFTYADNRYTWKSLEQTDGYKVYWVEGDLAFGQAVKDAIYNHFENFQQYLDLPTPETLSIYLYPTTSALQSALDMTNTRWVGGHADPVGHIILASIPAGFDQALEIKRQIPHEIIHIQLYMAMQENYSNLPAWFSEGLASLAEQHTSSEYQPILQAGWDNQKLIPFEKLCQSFPSSTDQAALAYAQVDSFTRFLFANYGKIGLESLLAAYTSGHTCENGVTTALGVSLQTLQADWQTATLDTSQPTGLNGEAAAWLGLLALLLVLPTGIAILQLVRKNKKNTHPADI
jgi:hypothetical protein